MDATPFRTLFFTSLEPISKSYNMKYSKNAFCAYQRLGDIFWSASFLCGFFLVDGQLEVKVYSRLKPCDFDEIQFAVIDPEKKHRITDTMRVTASFAAESLLIDVKTYDFPCGDPADFADKVEGYVRSIFDDLGEKQEAFLTSVMSTEGGLSPYLMHYWENYPFEAGMTYLCRGDYSAAKRCFELAEEKNCIVTKSIGKPGRYLHLVYIDYCEAMLTGVPWTDELAVNGFFADSI